MVLMTRKKMSSALGCQKEQQRKYQELEETADQGRNLPDQEQNRQNCWFILHRIRMVAICSTSALTKATKGET